MKRITQLKQSWTTVEKVYFIIRLILSNALSPLGVREFFLWLDAGQDDKNSANSLRLKTLVVRREGVLFALFS